MSKLATFLETHMRPERNVRLGLCILGSFSALAGLSIPAGAGLSLSKVLGEDLALPGLEDLTLELALAILGLALLARLALGIALEMVNVWASQRSLRRLQVAFHRHVLGLGYPEYQKLSHDKLLNVSFFELERVSLFKHGLSYRLTTSFVALIGALVLMGTISFEMSILVFFAGPLTYGVMRMAHSKVASISAAYWRQYGFTRETLLSDIENLVLIKLFGQSTIRERVYEAAASKLMMLQLKRVKVRESLRATRETIGYVGILTVIILGHTGLIGEPMKVSNLVTFILFAGVLTRPLREFANLYQEWSDVIGANERLESVLGAESEREDGLDLARAKGRLEVRNLEFSYRPGEPVLRGLSLSVDAGETVIIQGPNGAGKTTFLSLLSGLYEVSDGTIFLDGQDINAMSLKSLRRSISVVQQHTELLDATIRENIMFARPDASEDEFERAVNLALVEEFSGSLKDGLETKVGRRGLELSGGQRQRVSLARAILFDAPILILDEATSMFDPESEARFFERAAAYLGPKTVLMVTHRPPKTRMADRWFRLQNGQIFEESET